MPTRELEFDDAPALLAWIQDPAGSRFFMGETDGLTQADLEAFILSAHLTQTNHHLAITDQENQLVGLVSLKHLDFQRKQGEFSIGLQPAAQGKGLARAAARDLLAFAFIGLRLDRIYMYTLEENTATQRFNLRCGFRPLPGPPDGAAPDTDAPVRWYGLTQAEYQQMQAEQTGLFHCAS